MHNHGFRAEPSPAFTPEHQQLFGQLDRVIRAFELTQGEVARELELFAQQVKKRFADEEATFERQAYPRARKHREEHSAYALELDRAGREGVGAAGIAFLRAWLVNHATGSDHHHTEWLSQPGRRILRAVE